MSNFEESFKISDFREHVTSKGLWAGSVTPITIPELYGLSSNDEIIDIKSLHTPALLKSIDEIIVNAIDHCKECEKNKIQDKVSKIYANFNDDNYISIYNNGTGIPIIKDKQLNKYLIEYAFSKFLTGTNIEKPKDSIKGGINGLGAKITNVHSNVFIVETVYSKQKYIQTFKNRLTVIEEPIITETTSKDYTIIKFLLAFKELGYDEKINAQYLEEIDQWLKLRMYQVAAYVGDKIEVKYNNSLCTTTNSELFAQLISNSSNDIILSTVAKNNTDKHNMYISIIISKNSKKKNFMQNLTIINGVISTKGTHISYIRKYIKDYIDKQLNKLIKGNGTPVEKKDIYIKLIVFGSIPGIDWSGQNKDTVQVGNKIIERYKINEDFLKQLSIHVIDNIVINQNKKEIKVEHDKYTKAKNISNNKLKSQCILLAAEGDSAMTLLRTGLTQTINKKSMNDFCPSFNWFGIISLQGVIVNAAKEITEYKTTEGLKTLQSDKLKNNKRLNMLADAFGLKYEYSYKTVKELNTLNYGKLVLCTDQDLDGTGKIASLVLVWIHTFWPELLKNKKIGKLMTPVIRIYKDQLNVIEFHYEQELDKWLLENKNNKCRIKYYKGLATHDSNEAANMFKINNFNKNLYLYTMDDDADRLFKVYFGNDPSLRKQILITPVKHLTYEESIQLKISQEIPVGKVQLDIDTKLYKNEAISRQLPHAVDGLNPARRKILMASIIRFNSDSKEVKVFQLSGYVADKMLYHHGDASLNKTIITMAQSFKNARKYPYLLGIGQFGDRHGLTAGSPRYVSVKLNKIVNYIFPMEDRWILKYNFDEGVRAEPEYLVPILPMAILESYQIVTEGWNHKSYGYELESVIKLVMDYINGDKELMTLSERIHTNSNTTIPQNIVDKYKLTLEGDIRLYNNIEYSFGEYSYDSVNNLIIITELPINISTNNYIEHIKKSCDKYILKIDDYSSPELIEIYVYLKPDTIDIIMEKYGNDVIDPIEDFLNLKSSMNVNLNYYSCQKTVLEFKNCISTIMYWIVVRKELYKDRLIRKKILLNLKILLEESIIRYIELSNTLNISKIDNEDEVKKILVIKKFPGIKDSILHSPGYISNDLLSSSILIDQEYDYILDLKERELTKTSLNKRYVVLEKYKKEYNIVQDYLTELPFPGKTLWLEEINALLKII